jgi:hypothetical protein
VTELSIAPIRCFEECYECNRIKQNTEKWFQGGYRAVFLPVDIYVNTDEEALTV